MKFRLLTPTGIQMMRLTMLKSILRMKMEKIKRNNNRSSRCRPQQKSNRTLRQVTDYQPGDGLKEVTQIFILLLIQAIQQKWTTKLFFHLLDLTVFNSWILLFSCGAKYTHRNFRLLLVRNYIEEAGKSQEHSTTNWL